MADILLIEDMAGVRRAMTSILKTAGHTITVSVNGTEGIDQLQEQKFDLVVTDMLMPDLGGIGVLHHLRTMPNRPKVIAISGGGGGLSAEMSLRAARSLADAYLEKPVERTDLLAAVDRLLGTVG